MHIKGKGWDVADWIRLDQKRDEWWALVNTVMNLQIPLNKGNFWTNGGTIGFLKRTLFHAISLSIYPEKGKNQSKNRDWKQRKIKERKFKRGERDHQICITWSLKPDRLPASPCPSLMGSVRTRKIYKPVDRNLQSHPMVSHRFERGRLLLLQKSLYHEHSAQMNT